MFSSFALVQGCNCTAFVFVAVNLATFSYGTCIGWLSPATPTLQSRVTAVGRNDVTEDDTSWLRSLVFLGFLCGIPFFCYVSDKFGRKVAGLSTAVPAIISWLIIILGSSTKLVLVGRFFAGLSAGGVLLIVPIYVAEISEDSLRGALGTQVAIFADAGILFSYVVGPYSSYHDFAIICLAVPVTFLATFLWMPETPVYFMVKGEFKKARRSLRWFRGGKSHDMTDELTRMSVSLKETQGRNSSRSLIMNLLLDRAVRRALIIGIAVSTTQILSGLYVILSYNAADVSAISPLIVSLILLTAAILACLLMDRAGRKLLLVSSEIVMGIFLTFMGVYFYLEGQGVDLSNVSFIPVVCLGLHLFSFGAGVGPVNVVLLSEIFPPHVRSVCASICIFVMALLACAVSAFYSDLNNATGIHGPFWFIAAWSFLGAVFAKHCIPETKNINVHSIYAELRGRECSLIRVKKSYDMRHTSNEYKLQIALPSEN